MVFLKLFRLASNTRHIPIQWDEVCGFHDLQGLSTGVQEADPKPYLKRNLWSAGLLGIHCLTNSEQLCDRFPVPSHCSVGSLVVSQDVHGRLFNGLRFLVWSWSRNSGAECGSQTGYDGSIIPSKVI